MKYDFAMEKNTSDSPSDGTAGRARRGRPRAWADKTEQNTIKSLDRAMDVFAHLSRAQGRTLSELADDLDQSPATVYRILVTLEGRGLAEFDPAEQHWYIGAEAFVIGARFLRRTSLVERARPILRRLMEETGETANLGLPRDAFVLFVSQVETHQSIRAFFPPGTLSPLHASGIGKALLAWMDPVRRASHMATATLEQFTDHTLTDPVRLEADLTDTRARGYSLDREERNLGMHCVAAPVFDTHGEIVAGLSVSGPSTRVEQFGIEALGASVQAAARDLTDAIGGISARG